MQPGNPGSNALGSFTIPLHPPGSPGYRAAKATYDQLRRYQRVELYAGRSPNGIGLGKLVYAGIITGIQKAYDQNPTYQLTGVSDVGLANYSRPFPGELLSNDVTSATLKSYLGTNELGWSDTFNPFTSGNYTSTHVPGTTSGTWTGTTDDGFNVVSCATGSGAALISKTGAAPGDRWNTEFVEVTGRLSPSNDAASAGSVGIGLTVSNANVSDGVAVWFTAKKQAGRYNLDVAAANYSGGSRTAINSAINALVNTEDPQGMIPFTIGLLITYGGASSSAKNVTAIINGKVVISQYAIQYNPLASTQYPFLFFGIPATGSATGYFTNLVQFTRFTTDGGSTAAAFGNGSISASSVSLGYGVDPGPTFLETWTRLATRNAGYWRYTPQPYVIGTRTLGTVDFATDPGTDLTSKVIFRRRDGNLAGLEINNNADPLAADTALTGQATPDGGGTSYWRDIATLSKYGVIQDEALSFTHSDFNSLRRASYQVNANKIALDTLGAKTATVLREPSTADTYRELDKATFDDPEMGVNNLACRILARTFTEGATTETLILDQFSEEFTA